MWKYTTNEIVNDKLAGVDCGKYGKLNQNGTRKRRDKKYRQQGTCVEKESCHTLNKIPKMPAGDLLWSLICDICKKG